MVALPSLSSPASQNCTIRATKSLRGCALPGHRPPRCYDGKISRTAPHLNHLPQTVMRKPSSSLDATRKRTTTEAHGRINALAEGAQPYAGGRAESRRRHSGCFSATKHEENIFVCHVYDTPIGPAQYLQSAISGNAPLHGAETHIRACF